MELVHLVHMQKTWCLNWWILTFLKKLKLKKEVPERPLRSSEKQPKVFGQTLDWVKPGGTLLSTPKAGPLNFKLDYSRCGLFIR